MDCSTLVYPSLEYWSTLPFLSPGGLPDPGMEPASPALASGFSLPSSRGFSRPRNRARVACIAGGFFTSLATREALKRFPLWGVLHTSAFNSPGQRRLPETSVKGTRTLQRSPRHHEVPPSPGAASSERRPFSRAGAEVLLASEPPAGPSPRAATSGQTLG